MNRLIPQWRLAQIASAFSNPPRLPVVLVGKSSKIENLELALAKAIRERDEAWGFLAARAHMEDRLNKITVSVVDGRQAFYNKIRTGSPARLTVTSRWLTTAELPIHDEK